MLTPRSNSAPAASRRPGRPSATGMALVAFGDTIATGRTYATRNGYQVDANRELLALGTANVASGLSQGIAMSSSGSRTALNYASGGVPTARTSWTA
jgi:MFS superfamily sulfate permease-like transporter